MQPIPTLVMLTLFALSFPGRAAAQIVDVQARFAEARQPGLDGAIEGSVDWRTGNNDYLSAKAAVSGSWRSDPHLLLLLASGESQRAEERVALARLLEHLRYRYRLREWLLPEVFVQHEYDRFRRLTVRALVGAGPRFEVLRDQVRLALGVALMYEHDQLRDDGQPDAGRRIDEVRASTYLIGSAPLATGLRASQTVYFQPRLDHPQDYRVLSETALLAHPNERLTLGMAFVLSVDTGPPAGVEPVDTQLRSTLAFRF